MTLYLLVSCIFQAEEITLTIGQAFDLAYKKFLESHSNEGDLKKQYIILQKKVSSCSIAWGLCWGDSELLTCHVVQGIVDLSV